MVFFEFQKNRKKGGKPPLQTPYKFLKLENGSIFGAKDTGHAQCTLHTHVRGARSLCGDANEMPMCGAAAAYT